MNPINNGPTWQGNYSQPNTSAYVPPATVGTEGVYTTNLALLVTGPTWPGNYHQPS